MKGFEENKKKDIDNLKKRCMGRGVYINGQGRAPYHHYHFGLGTSGKNGCLAFAIYNCNISLGLYDNISGIIHRIVQYGGMVFGGYLGANPWVLIPYYRSRGCEVRFLLFPSVSGIEKRMKSVETGILMYLWWGRGVGSHYVAMERKESDGNMYYVYNESNQAAAPRRYKTLKDFRGGNNLPLIYVSIKRI